MDINSETEKVERSNGWSPATLIDRVLARVVEGFALVAGVAVAVLVLALIREVVGRYLFNSPTAWVDEVSGYTAAGVTFLGAAYALRHGELVSVTLLSERMGERLRRVSLAIGLLVAVIVLSVVVYSVAGFVWEIYETGARSNTALRVPQWIPRAVMLVGLIVLLLETVRQAIVAVIGAITSQRAKGA